MINKSSFNLKFLIGLVMFIIYLTVGGLILFSDFLVKISSFAVKISFGSAIIVYGFFRLYRAIKVNREENSDEDENTN